MVNHNVDFSNALATIIHQATNKASQVASGSSWLLHMTAHIPHKICTQAASMIVNWSGNV